MTSPLMRPQGAVNQILSEASLSHTYTHKHMSTHTQVWPHHHHIPGFTLLPPSPPKPLPLSHVNTLSALSPPLTATPISDSIVSHQKASVFSEIIDLLATARSLTLVSAISFSFPPTQGCTQSVLGKVLWERPLTCKWLGWSQVLAVAGLISVI